MLTNEPSKLEGFVEGELASMLSNAAREFSCEEFGFVMTAFPVLADMSGMNPEYHFAQFFLALQLYIDNEMFDKSLARAFSSILVNGRLLAFPQAFFDFMHSVFFKIAHKLVVNSDFGSDLVFAIVYNIAGPGDFLSEKLAIFRNYQLQNRHHMFEDFLANFLHFAALLAGTHAEVARRISFVAPFWVESVIRSLNGNQKALLDLTVLLSHVALVRPESYYFNDKYILTMIAALTKENHRSDVKRYALITYFAIVGGGFRSITNNTELVDIVSVLDLYESEDGGFLALHDQAIAAFDMMCGWYPSDGATRFLLQCFREILDKEVPVASGPD
jgi:hypothetical protein